MEKNSNILENEELKKLAYKVPEGYFDELSGQMVEKVGRKEASTPLVRKLTPYLAMAAAFLFLAVGGTLLLRLTTPEKPDITAENQSEITSSEITSDDIVAYMIYSSADFEEFEDLLDE